MAGVRYSHHQQQQQQRRMYETIPSNHTSDDEEEENGVEYPSASSSSSSPRSRFVSSMTRHLGGTLGRRAVLHTNEIDHDDDEEEEEEADDDDGRYWDASDGERGMHAMRAGGAAYTNPDEYNDDEEDLIPDRDPFGDGTRGGQRGRRNRSRGEMGECSEPGAIMRTFWFYAGIALLITLLVLIGHHREGKDGAAAPHNNDVTIEGRPLHPDGKEGSSNSSGSSSSHVIRPPESDQQEVDNNMDRDHVEAERAQDDSSSSSDDIGEKNTNTKQSKGCQSQSNSFHKKIVQFDPTARSHPYDPFRLSPSKGMGGGGDVYNNWYGSIFASPPHPAFMNTEEESSLLSSDNDDHTNDNLGYLQSPSVHNGTIVFCSEGDLYLTYLPPPSTAATATATASEKIRIPAMAAMKLTATVGNVLAPKINPEHPHLVAFTATYTGVREVYVMDLRPSFRNRPSMRLTYFDSSYGVSDVIGWDYDDDDDDDGDGNDNMSIIIAAHNIEIGMPDVRLYKIGIRQQGRGAGGGGVGGGEDGISSTTKEGLVKKEDNNNDDDDDDDGYDDDEDDDDNDDDGNDNTDGNRLTARRVSDQSITSRKNDVSHRLRAGGTRNPISVSEISPVSLSQAIDGVVDAPTRCLFFTRYKQSSNTARYVGGTAEHLWVHCPADDAALPLTDDYRGTSRAPRIWSDPEFSFDDDGKRFLFFLSDRVKDDDDEKEEKGQGWIPSTMNLWAAEILLQKDSDDGDNDPNAPFVIGDDDEIIGEPFQLTAVACEFNGIALSEYAIDPVRGDVILRIGADLHLLRGEEVADLLKKGGIGKGNTERRIMKEEEEENLNGGVLNDERDLETKKKRKKKKPTTAGDNSDVSTAKTGSVQVEGAAQRSRPSSFTRLPIAVYSDFHNQHERLIPALIPEDVTSVDIYETPYGTTSALLTLRGQLYVAPTIDDLELAQPYQGAGMNIPPRRYRVAPGSTTGGMVRILASLHVPIPEETGRRLALVLATDPLSITAEQAFYIVATDAGAVPSFAEVMELPDPILGGHINGGSTKDGGLGSINVDSVAVSPCGRRAAWTDTDGRICTMTLPLYNNETQAEVTVLPLENENGEPMIGIEADLTWSPGGRYLAVEHSARNQFTIISIADLGDPEEGVVEVGRVVQATPDRFNSMRPYWGKTALDFSLAEKAKLFKLGSKGDPDSHEGGATTLYFLTDRDVMTDVRSPWGTRAPSPHFPKKLSVYALPLMTDEAYIEEVNPGKLLFQGAYPAGGAAELLVDELVALAEAVALLEDGKDSKDEEDEDKELDGLDRRMLGKLNAKQILRELLAGAQPSIKLVDDRGSTRKVSRRRLAKRKKPSDTSNAKTIDKDSTSADGTSPTSTPTTMPSVDDEPVIEFPADNEITFGPKSDPSLSFARRAYRMDYIPPDNYLSILCQPSDDPSLVLFSAPEKSAKEGPSIVVFAADSFPADTMEAIPLKIPGEVIEMVGLATTREFLYIVISGIMKVVPNTSSGIVGMIKSFPDGSAMTTDIVDTEGIALSVWPSLEYHQMYSDAWRMLRDYFYDPGMTNLNWPEIHRRFLPLVKRCSKREEFDDVLRQMAAELSALHVFVYGGEYPDPTHGSRIFKSIHKVASLGARLQRSSEWNGYVITSIPERDPDFDSLDGDAMYSPLSQRTLGLSGQRGLAVGDVIVGVNGESVMRVPDIHMLLRGMAGRSVRLDVLRITSSSPTSPGRRGKRALQEEADEDEEEGGIVVEPVIAVPITPDQAADLRYAAWEWKTREMAKSLAAKAGFTCGYVHLQSMSGASAEDAFVRGFYPDYDKQALIVDVRHNSGGNIDSWLLDVLQRRAWMYWQGRATNITNGGLGWDEQFAFRGHLVVLIDEHTSSDGEGFSRGVSELGLGKLVGTRTWGGGIWLSSDNNLVDGGIATAPEIGTYNKNFGWGLGIEQIGVEPHVEVDNNPRQEYDGKDEQLERAIQVLRDWLKDEPVVLPKSPGPHRDMSLHKDAMGCPAAK